MFFRGFKFGLMLQIAIGPVCIFIFNTAGTAGFYSSLSAVLAVVLADALYIFLASLGISGLQKIKKHEKLLNIIGAAIILLFAADIITGTIWGIRLLPGFSSGTRPPIQGSFLQAFLLTMSNPLTILFWSGVFTVKVTEEKLSRAGLFSFGSGAVLSTFVFLSLIAAAGTAFREFLPTIAVSAMNLAVAAALAVFAVRNSCATSKRGV